MKNALSVYVSNEMLLELENNRKEGETLNQALLRFAREGLHYATSQLDVEGQHIKNLCHATKWIYENYKSRRSVKDRVIAMFEKCVREL